MKLKDYSIRLCKKEEYGQLINFIHEYWSSSHVFCTNKKIFEFQHGTAEDGSYDFIVAVHNSTNEFHAVLGYISSSKYDGGDPTCPKVIFGALWKVRDDIQNKEIGKLGLGVLYYLLRRFPDSDYITSGISGDSQQIYDSLHFDFGKLSHYYIASNCLEKFVICDNPVYQVNTIINNELSIREVEDIPSEWETSYYPKKNAEYYRNRYENHPFYHYLFLGIYKNNELICIWVVRRISVDSSSCLRIVDMIGDFHIRFDIIGNIQELLKEQHAEYIDCYNHGIEKEYFTTMGFIEIGEGTIIPNYFEPFEKKNVDIHYAAYAKHSVVVFKGDADQDRPSILPIDNCMDT